MFDIDGQTSDATVDCGRLPELMGFLLRMAQLQFFADFFEALPDFRLKPGEMSVLELIDRNPGVRPGQIAEILHILQPHMTKLVRRFEARGLLTRTVSPNDRRSVELRLTATGRDELVAHWDRLRAHEESRNSRLTPAEEATLVALLGKLTGFEKAPETGRAPHIHREEIE
jgi:DNA-binding MarR family transcriptional regulator